MQKSDITTKQMWILIFLAYSFSFIVRLIWAYQFKDVGDFYYNNQFMINTNDGYFFASGVQKALFGVHDYIHRVPDLWHYGAVAITTFLVKMTPLSLESVIFYAPAVFSSLVVIPIILITRLFHKTLWGFFAALLGSITWSYYNRTMLGYYDTDMFSIITPMFILYFLIKSTIDLELKTLLYGAIWIIVYPFLYDQGFSVFYAMGLIYLVYMLYYHKKEQFIYGFLTLLLVSLTPFLWQPPYGYIVHIFIAIAIYFIFEKKIIKNNTYLLAITIVAFLIFMIVGDVFSLIWTKVAGYTIHGTEDGALHFFAVNQTIREAGIIPFDVFANRTSGSIYGVVLALFGYIYLVVKKPVFILALPLIGIGVFSLWGGLRFTVYAVPIAAMSSTYIIYLLVERFIVGKKKQFGAMVILTSVLLYPNVIHIIGYKVPTVFNKAEVEDLDRLNKIASPKDYTLSWWDYGYPIWYYSDTSTLIDGGKHDHDNYIISKILFSSSPMQVANLSRLAVEDYENNGHKIVADSLFEKQNPQILLESLKSADYQLPQKTRDVYIYMPYRMLNIFPTIGLFGNIDLKTGKKLRKIAFYQTQAIKQDGQMLFFANGIVFDVAKGVVSFKNKLIGKVYKFDISEYKADKKLKVKTNLYHFDGDLCVVYLKSYNKFVVMDKESYNSAFVQMFMLENYDKNLFELVVSSGYSKIYKVKR